MTAPTISFILIEYHSLDDLPAAFDAIRAASGGLDSEIIVSSNSSYPEMEQLRLRSDFPGVAWVFNSGNGGFAAGMNAGIRASKGDWVVLSNPDARIQRGSFAAAIAWFAAHPKVAVIGPRIIGPDGTVQDSCRRFMTMPRFVARQLRRLFTRRLVLHELCAEALQSQAVDWVIGGFMMIRRDALSIVGLLDDGYFLYVEDMDWCKRFWDAGFEVWYYPDLAVCYAGDRKSTASITNPGRFKYAWWHLKSYMRFLRKHGLFPERQPENDR